MPRRWHRSAPPIRGLAVLLDHFDAGGPLETEAIGAILVERGLSGPLPSDYHRIGYPFVTEAR